MPHPRSKSHNQTVYRPAVAGLQLKASWALGRPDSVSHTYGWQQRPAAGTGAQGERDSRATGQEHKMASERELDTLRPAES